MRYNFQGHYVGGHASAHAIRALGGVYGGNDKWDDLVDKASEREVKEVYNYLKGYIDFMQKNPTKICPCCKQICRA